LPCAQKHCLEKAIQDVIAANHIVFAITARPLT